MNIAVTENQHHLAMELAMLNRHGLITGATGTGKTVTLKVIAEKMSQEGIPVFLADIKGDLASLAQPGVESENITSRVEKLGLTDYEPKAYPVRLWDVFGKDGTPLRATVSEMGPTLLSRLLGLNATQQGVLNIVFKIADDSGLLLLDLKDLQAILQEVGNNASAYTTQYGNVTKQSVGAIQRSLLALEQQGAEQFFGEPGIQLGDFIQHAPDGRGYINVLMAKELFHSPLLYSTFLLWLLTELFQDLPEVGDLEKPKIVFFFDEAHLLFKNAPKGFIDEVEQVVRLIRSKGVGVFFVTQNPLDLPENILGQLGNRVQHAIRAYTPKELKNVKAAADTFRPNPELDVAEVITQLKVGEALISFLNPQGQPSVVERGMVRPPESFMGAVDPLLLPPLMAQNPYELLYRTGLDRESAYEMLSLKVEKERVQKEVETIQEEEEKQRKVAEKAAEKAAKEQQAKKKKDPVQKAANSFFDSIARQAGREFSRGIMNVLKKKK